MINDIKIQDIIEKIDENIIEQEKSRGETHHLWDIHESDIAEALESLKKDDEAKFHFYIDKIPKSVVAEAILELPEAYQEELAHKISSKDLSSIVNELDTDDATDFIQIIEEQDEQKAYEVLKGLNEEHKEDIEVLKRFEEDTAGSIMQVELFYAFIDEKIIDAISRLRELKAQDSVENIHYVFITDRSERLLSLISLEDLILLDFDKTFEDLRERLDEPIFVYSNESTDEVAYIVEKYNLSVLPVVNEKKQILGRITSDDIYDLIEDSATEQIYSLANVDGEEELEDSVAETGKRRVQWLFINMMTAIVASVVIGLFANTIDSIVALAVLMPIVASMGGIAGTQTLTVVVRQMALGEIDKENAKHTIKKELQIGLINGAIFSLLATLLAWAWFGQAILGGIMAIAMFVNLSLAALSGVTIPLTLKKFGIDPAIASGVLLTTITDVVGFFTFLGLATAVLI